MLSNRSLEGSACDRKLFRRPHPLLQFLPLVFNNNNSRNRKRENKQPYQHLRNSQLKITAGNKVLLHKPYIGQQPEQYINIQLNK